MRRRARTVLSAGVGVVVLLCGLTSNDGWTAPPTWLDQDRFRELPWGATSETAQTVYRDLTFVRYAIDNEKDTPSKVYERKDEVLKIDGIRVDEFRYWFRENAFYKVTVTLQSKLGPRTLETPSAVAFEELFATICRVAGEPIEDHTRRGGWDGARWGGWHLGGISITLRHVEHPGDNTDEMDMEIVNTSAGPVYNTPAGTGEP
jgi:hypothetical protein